MGDQYLSEKEFLYLWRLVFPYVKVRKYKSSCGHCAVCTLLAEMRRKFKDKVGRREVTNLFALHRLASMGERRSYYDRRLLGQLYPHNFWSSIADGMQQNHCMLPWYGNQKFPGFHAKQHLQGVLVHGDNVTVYRTFTNVKGGANLAIHTFLLSLEAYANAHDGNLAKVIQHQIDGGSENANKEFIAICILLVASGLVDKVILTRLLVGHTHEDIDALFAFIWKELRDTFVHTPSEFVALIKHALRKKGNVVVKDLFAIPDYCAMLEGRIDPQFGRFAKQEWTQHQIIFERSSDVVAHPTYAVKMTCRPYAEDEVTEIVKVTREELAQDPVKYGTVTGLIPQICKVETRPFPNAPR